MDDTTSFLIVEDQPSVLEWSIELVRSALPLTEIVSATSANEARQLTARTPVDIALIGLAMPHGETFDVIADLVRLCPLIMCIVITDREDDDCVLPVLIAGAQGYLLRSQDSTLLKEQLHLAVAGIPPLAPGVARRMLRHFARPEIAAVATKLEAPETFDDSLVKLSHREKIVLTLIAKGLQISQVAHTLNISTHTVCSHLKNIYRKRNLSCRADAALEAHRLGLVR